MRSSRARRLSGTLACVVSVAVLALPAPLDAGHAGGPANSNHSSHPVKVDMHFPVAAESFVGNHNRRYPFVDDFCLYDPTKNRPNSQCLNGNGHQGNDIYPYTSHDNRYQVLAPESGYLENRSCQSGGGLTLWLTNTPSGVRYKLMHLASGSAISSRWVSRGQFLGRVGRTQTSSCTGSTTPHVHFEMYAGGSFSTSNLRCPYTSLVGAFRRPGEHFTPDIITDRIASAFYTSWRGGGREVSGWAVERPGVSRMWLTSWGSGRAQEFDGGSRGPNTILDHTSYGSFVMWGAIRQKYHRMRSWYSDMPNGTLGWLLSDESDAARSPSGHTGRYNRFQYGAILWDAWTGRAWEVHGAIRQHYDSIGGSGSYLGFPISDEHYHYNPQVGYNVAYSAFEDGCITWQNGGWRGARWGSGVCGSKHNHGEGPNG